MTPDSKFEDELFTLYGEEPAEPESRVLAEQVSHRVEQEERMRRILMAGTAGAGGATGAAIVASSAGPLKEFASGFTPAPQVLVWGVGIVAAVVCGIIAARLIRDT